MYWLAKYGVQTSFRFSMIKRGVVDLAATADWTPVNADSKVSQSGGTMTTTTNTVTAIAGTGSVGWNLTLTNTELTTAEVYVQIVDAATKAVEDNSFVIYTYGHASAKIPADLSDLVRLGLTALPNAAAEAAGGLYTRGTGAGQINQPTNGMVDGNVVRWLNTAVATPTTAGIPRVAIEAAGDFIQAAADKVWASATRTLTAFSTALAVSVWDVAATAVALAGSIGLQIKNSLDVTVSSRSTYAGGAVASVTGAVGSVTGNVGGNVTGSVGSVATGGITAASFAAGAIDANAVATDAITSAELATSAITEIQAGLATSAALTTAQTDVTAIKTKTDQLVFGTANRVDSTVVDKTGFALTTAERDAVAAALLDLANGVETGKTVRQSLRAMAAILAGDVTGAGTSTELFKAIGNAGTTRVTVPVDANGNRTGVTVS